MFVLSEKNSIASDYMAEMRDSVIQTDRIRFRTNLERVGAILAYEISKDLTYSEKLIQTPLGISRMQTLKSQIVLATILRAGLPFHQGFLNMFDKAENAFIGAYRGNYQNVDALEVKMDYISCPDLRDKILIIIDPMLATGRSMEKAYHGLLRFGIPRQTIIASVIGSEAGVRHVKQSMSECKLYIGAVDKYLDEHHYIVPGLGDAGDLAFGSK
jgi:uracil phosphoribosyltransferase